MAGIYEIIRQAHHLVPGRQDRGARRRLADRLGVRGRVEVAYTFGHEIRGLSPASRRMVEESHCQVIAETSNAGYQWRFLAAAMGVPFIPSRNLLGTDTLAHSSAKVVTDPWSGKPICLLPACYPDVALIHVSRCDMYGNAQIDGTMVEDFELARAARRLILTTEEIVPDEQIRAEPWRTVIPFFLVDAVVEAPHGAHPCQMPRRYYFDEDHIRAWMQCSKTAEGAPSVLPGIRVRRAGLRCLEKVGGLKKLHHLKKVEQLCAGE